MTAREARKPGRRSPAFSKTPAIVNRSGIPNGTEEFAAGQGDESSSFTVRASEAEWLIADMLRESGIDVGTAEARGYRWLTTERDVLKALGFNIRQCELLPGLLIPTHGVDGSGVVTYQFRPVRPRNPPHGKPIKYESVPGRPLRLDCHPHTQPLLADASVPLWITEGVKKGDAAASQGLVCVALPGVDCWRDKGGPLPDWDHVVLARRRVFIAYDSDVMTKASVQSALTALTTFLAMRGAVVRWIILPPGESDLFDVPGKQGLDDFLAAGRTPDDVMPLAQVPRLPVFVDGDLATETERAIAGLQVQNDPPTLFHLGARELVEAVGNRTYEMTNERLTVLASRNLRFQRHKGDDVVTADPKSAIVSGVLASWDRWPFPRLERITGTPTFAPDGSLRTEPGYHAPSRTLHVPDHGLTIRPVPPRPTRRDVRRALVLLRDELFGDFPFLSDADLAHAIAMVLEPFVRDLIRGLTPLYVPSAPAQGTGKTLLVRSALGPAYGRVEGGISEPHSDEELEKRITAAILAGQQFFLIDNVSQVVKWQSLAAALTKSHWEGRKLGKSEVVNAPNRMLWALTGNNPQFTDDMARRVVPIRMDAQLERPQDRGGFHHSLPAWAQVHGRADLVWAACVLVQNWLALNRPHVEPGVPNFGSFSAWRRVMGGVLWSAGVPGFLANLASVNNSNEEADGFTYLIRGIFKARGSKPFRAGELAQTAQVNAQLAAVIDVGGRRWTDHGLLIEIGRYLAMRTGKVADGLRLERLEKKHQSGVPLYRVGQVGA